MPKQRSRTISFPRYSLETCEQWLVKLPPARPLERTKLLEEIGYTNPTSGPAGSAMGALGMFDLVRKQENLYELTSLGRTLRTPISGVQARVLRMVAFLLPEIFRAFYQELKGQRMNRRGYLSSLLSQKHTVTDKVAATFEKAFIDSGLHAKVLSAISKTEIRILNVDTLISSVELNLESLTETPESILALTSNEESCRRLLKHIAEFDKETEPASVQSESAGGQLLAISEDVAIDNLSPILRGNHEAILFELDDGTYVIDKAELIDFLLKQGKKTNQDKPRL